MKNFLSIATFAAALCLGFALNPMAGTAETGTATGSVPVAATAAVPGLPPSDADVVMASHKAIYDFRMIGVASGQGGISDIRGSMYYEQDDSCDAWTTDHRFTSDYYSPERPVMRSNSQYASWESKDGRQLQFSSERQENGESVENLRGAVERRDDGTATAQYTRPENLSYELPKGYLLPTQQMIETIRHARAGDKFYNVVMFDGTDADGPVEVNTFIGKPATPEEIAAIRANSDKIDAHLLAAPAWHVRMAVFPLYPKDGVDGSLPSYEMDLILHDNGVISDAVVDYKQFKVGQKLTALESFSPKPCP